MKRKEIWLKIYQKLPLIERLRRWFNGISIQKKLMLAYSILALVPMLIIAGYTYRNTKQILLNGLYEDLTAQLELTRKKLDEKTNGFYAVSNMIYMDSTLQSYLTVDYSNQGYEDLYMYVDDLFTGMQTLYPDICNISIYSSNQTLPQDKYYFYSLDAENLPDWYGKTSRAGGILYMESQPDGLISFTRLLNLYESGNYEIFIELKMDQDTVNEMLNTGDDEVTIVLTDEAGIVDAASTPALIGKELELEDQIVVSAATKYCGTLQMFTDPGRFDAQAGKAASGIFLVFFASAGMALAASYIYSRSFKRNVQKVLDGAKSIGDGNLEYRILNPGRDEIGQIAESVNLMGTRISHLIEESYKKELARKSSELNLLQEQINPHFLYNALSSISSLAMKNKDRETSQAIVYLSEFYRISLNKGKQELSVREELSLLESYLKIQKMRFGDTIIVEYDLDESLLERKVMKLTLQPIVENAIHHGRTDASDYFHILIRLFEEQDKTVLEIIDDGCGIPADKLMQLQNSMNQAQGGYGLRNVNIRIRLQYGERYGVYIESEPGFGTKVRIELPGA